MTTPPAPTHYAYRRYKEGRGYCFEKQPCYCTKTKNHAMPRTKASK